MRARYDYVVVGSGAGAVVAARLAEDPDVTVCLVEAGPSDEGNDRVLDLSRWAELLGTHLDYDYEIEPQHRGNSSIRQSRGRMLGGSTSHNGCVAFRPPDRDLEIWVDSGGVGWGPEECRPYFERLKSKMAFRFNESDNPLLHAFLAAAEEAGLKRSTFSLDMPDAHDAVGWTLLSANGLTRQSSSVAYLHPLSDLPDNLQVQCDTIATRIVVNSLGRATAVETTTGTFEAREEIVVACGAFESPKLLMLSGIGPKDHISSLGIPLTHELNGVGDHLLDHTEAALMWEASRPFLHSTMIDVAALYRSSEDEPTADILSFFVPATYADLVAEEPPRAGSEDSRNMRFASGFAQPDPEASAMYVYVRGIRSTRPG